MARTARFVVPRKSGNPGTATHQRSKSRRRGNWWLSRIPGYFGSTAGREAYADGGGSTEVAKEVGLSLTNLDFWRDLFAMAEYGLEPFAEGVEAAIEDSCTGQLLLDRVDAIENIPWE